MSQQIEQLKTMSAPNYSFSLIFLLLTFGLIGCEYLLRENIIPDPETIQLIGTIGETLGVSIPIPTPDELPFSQYIINKLETAAKVFAIEHYLESYDSEIATAIVEAIFGPEDAEELLAEASAATDEQPQQK